MAPVQFTKIDDYTTMTAEWAMVDNNIVVHFFLPDEVLAVRTGRPPNSEEERDTWSSHFLSHDREISKYWKEIFPAVLEPAAVAAFHAKPPRLVAAYTEELGSWWLQAKGFNVLKPEMLVNDLLTRLDQGLDAAGAASLLARNST
jgi:hypothetical protein